jgi:hypothetical protein
MIKKIVMLSAFLITGFFANAQLDKGVWLVGGSGSFFSYKLQIKSQYVDYPNGHYTDILISPDIGYFVANRFAIGLRPTFSSYKGENTSTIISNQRQFFAGPFIRYYFLNPEKQFNILTDVCYQLGINKEGLPRRMDHGSINNFWLMAGPEIFFNSSVGMEVLIGYNYKKSTVKYPEAPNLDIRKGFQTSIGFKLHLEKL